MKSIEELEILAGQIRYIVTDMICRAGSGHIGGSLGIVDILIALYFRVMKNASTGQPDRDRFILSKGHSGPALYAVLAFKGVIPFEWLATLNKPGTNLPSHVDRLKTPGIEMTAGSLGQGLSVAAGIALAMKQNNNTSRVFCLIGDGETQEGQIWEAAMFASHHNLNNLICITDVNGLQIDGATEEVISLGSLHAKWESFGWQVLDVDGHNIESLVDTLNKSKESDNKPVMVLARTVKAKGNVCFEGQVGSHHIRIADENAYRKYMEGVEGKGYKLPY